MDRHIDELSETRVFESGPFEMSLRNVATGLRWNNFRQNRLSMTRGSGCVESSMLVMFLFNRVAWKSANHATTSFSLK